MAISAQDVKTLRERTGAGMMDCKKALTETSGNFDEAVEFLKKQGLAKAEKKGDRVAAEGLIFTKVEGDQAVLVEINCETDFVSKNEDFLKLGQQISDTLLANKPASLDEAFQLKLGDVSIEEAVNNSIAVIGEKISLRRFEIVAPQEGGAVTLYNHGGGRIAVLIEIVGDKVPADAARDVAMQVAAMNPRFVDKSQVSQDVLDKEKEIQMAQMAESGKPQEILEKIMIGKLDKFASEMSLNQQVFVKDMGGKKKVEQHLKDLDSNAKIVRFVRFEVGEGIEKRADDFVDEVKKMAQGA